MRKGIFSEELGGTAGCVMRGAIDTAVFKYHTSKKDDDNYEEIKEPEEPILYLGDSWFESVKTCINIGKARYHGCFIVNQKHFEQEIYLGTITALFYVIKHDKFLTLYYVLHHPIFYRMYDNKPLDN